MDKQKVLEIILKKTIFDKNPQVLKNILVETPFDIIKMYWNEVIVCAKNIRLSFEEAIKIFIEDIEIVFSGAINNGYYNFSYFGPELRNPIIKAGREQTLLKIIYKGDERMIEPYSLKFMEKKDGDELEYLYAYKISGGKSEPGIRMFVAEKFQKIENTDIKFEPRHQIETSKSGEKPDNPLLFDPNRPEPTPRKKRLRQSYGSEVKYVYKCTYCGKKFYRGKLNNKINSHKTESGFDCHSGFGEYIGTKYY